MKSGIGKMAEKKNETGKEQSKTGYYLLIKQWIQPGRNICEKGTEPAQENY